MAFITAVYIVDIGPLSEVGSIRAAGNWMRVQWVGIAFVPAAYLHFSDALLRTTGALSRWRRIQMLGAYVIGLVSLFLALFTDLLVRDAIEVDGLYHLQPGRLFWMFAHLLRADQPRRLGAHQAGAAPLRHLHLTPAHVLPDAGLRGPQPSGRSLIC